MNPEFYCDKIPDWMGPFLSVPEMIRIRKVGMDCGCEYTSFARFRGFSLYSRYDHSLGCALIVWRFTKSREQALSALFHDIATPVFAHTVDFLNGDHLRQESTEAGTADLIRNSKEITALLSELGLGVESVTDYHRYPVADNNAPKLSSDRLEYTITNAVRYGFLSVSEAKECLLDLFVFTHPNGTPELSFRHTEKARIFAYAALSCSRVYVSEEDRYAMQRLSELLRDAIRKGTLREKDLYGTEAAIIRKIEEDEELFAAWRDFRSLSLMVQDPEEMPEEKKRVVPAKKRYIDPLADDRRLSDTDTAFAEAIREYLNEPQDHPICGIGRKERGEETSIRKALPSEADAVISFYNELIDAMQGKPFNHIWKKDVYPDSDLIRSAIRNGELYVMTDGTEILSSMILNHAFGEGYEDVRWSVDAESGEVIVIHLLGVAASCQGKGIAKEMTRYAIEKARETGMKAVRLDVLSGNTPAERAYASVGFRYICTRSMRYGEAVPSFRLFELPVEKN